MVVLSLAIHLTAATFLAGGLFPPSRRDTSPVCYVDLLNLPVRDPQAGRPDARPPAEPAPAVRPEPPAAVPPVPKPPPVVVKPEAKVAPKETLKPAPKISEEDEKDFAEKMRRLQARKDEEDFNTTMRNLANRRQNASAPVEAPAGMATGKGKSAGVDEQLWIQAYLKECWNLSKYQVTRRDLKATARLVFDAGGMLVDYRIISSSGDNNFDESVRRAILKAKQLPFRPGRRLELDGDEAVEFNLKDLLD